MFLIKPFLRNCTKATKHYITSSRERFMHRVVITYLLHDVIHRITKYESYMYTSAHVLMNLLNELGKRDKMRELPSILSLFATSYINKTGPRILD